MPLAQRPLFANIILYLKTIFINFFQLYSLIFRDFYLCILCKICDELLRKIKSVPFKNDTPLILIAAAVLLYSVCINLLVLKLRLHLVKRFTKISNLRNSRKPLILSGFSAVFVLVDFKILSAFLTVTSSKSQPSA